ALTALAAFGSVCTTQAADLVDLYETTQPVITSNEAAFAEALRTVIVRVSGRRDAPARLGAALDDPQRYVQRYGFTTQDILQVGFDSMSIDRLLLEAGLPVWGRERPATLVALALPQSNGSLRWVSADAPAAEREAIERAAHERGLPLVWATLDVQDQAQLDPAGPPGAVLQLAQRHGADAALLGQSYGSGAAHWALFTDDGARRSSGAFTDGVHLAADAFAQAFAATGSMLDTIIVEVSGLADLEAYAETLNYLEGVTLVRSVAVEQVSGDTIRFRLAVRGDAQTLRRAIDLGRTLIASTAAGGGPGERLVFRYQR